VTRCERCRKRPPTIHAYWGALLCTPCAVAVAELLDQHNAWPAVPWTNDDEEVLR
jgi:hypothetical protein